MLNVRRQTDLLNHYDIRAVKQKEFCRLTSLFLNFLVTVQSYYLIRLKFVSLGMEKGIYVCLCKYVGKKQCNTWYIYLGTLVYYLHMLFRIRLGVENITFLICIKYKTIFLKCGHKNLSFEVSIIGI